jgi:Zn finger protein HypA/HybF involved in hydrogenase expression
MIPRLTIRRCEYCDAEISLEEELARCPNCGGSIKTDVEKLSLSKGDFFSMDE